MQELMSLLEKHGAVSTDAVCDFPGKQEFSAFSTIGVRVGESVNIGNQGDIHFAIARSRCQEAMELPTADSRCVR